MVEFFRKKFNMTYAICFLGAIVTFLIPLFVQSKYVFHSIFCGILFTVILLFLYKKERKYLFEPIYIFSLYYLTVPIVIWYYILTDFSTNKFVTAVTYNGDFNVLFFITILYFLIGYVAAIFGYKKINKHLNICEMEFDSTQKISDFSCYFVGGSFILIGLLNFIYNVIKFANGNVLIYILNMANRTKEFASGGTTLGYTIAAVGGFVLLFTALRTPSKKKMIIFFFSFFCICTMQLSTGRIFSTISYIAIIVAVYYFSFVSKKKKIDNRVFLIFGGSLLLVGILVYFIRMVGGLSSVNQMNQSVVSYFTNFVENIGYYAIDKGNMPNIALVPKIIDSWGTDIGYLLGTSLFAGLFTFLPVNFLTIAVIPAKIVKITWYSNVSSGNLPITIIGELFANFGWLGPVIGMFLFGLVITWLFRYTLKKKNYWVYVVMMQVTIGFIALSPKGEFNNISLWMIIPYILTYGLLIILTYIERRFRK